MLNYASSNKVGGLWSHVQGEIIVIQDPYRQSSERPQFEPHLEWIYVPPLLG